MLTLHDVRHFIEEKDAALWKFVHLDVGRARFCVRLMIASAITLVFVFVQAIENALKKPAWAFITVQIVAQASAGSSTVKGLNRIIGTSLAAGSDLTE